MTSRTKYKETRLQDSRVTISVQKTKFLRFPLENSAKTVFSTSPNLVYRKKKNSKKIVKIDGPFNYMVCNESFLRETKKCFVWVSYVNVALICLPRYLQSVGRITKIHIHEIVQYKCVFTSGGADGGAVMQRHPLGSDKLIDWNCVCSGVFMLLCC